MTWHHVAYKDLKMSLRSRLLLGLSTLFVLMVAGGSVALTVLPSDSPIRGATLSSDTALIVLLGVSSWLVPIIAIVATYTAIVGERDSGSLRLLLGLGHTRRSILAGKLVGRSAMLLVSLLAGFTAALVVILTMYDRLYAANFAIFALSTSLFALVYVGLTTGVSASLDSRSQVIAVVVGVFAFFQFLWDGILIGILFLVTGDLPVPGENYPAWYVFLTRLSPTNAYEGVVSGVASVGQLPGIPNLSESLTGVESVPFYLSQWAALAILLFWFVIPILVGAVRFSNADLQ